MTLDDGDAAVSARQQRLDLDADYSWLPPGRHLLMPDVAARLRAEGLPKLPYAVGGQHPTVLVGVNDELAWIDVEMAPLIFAAWRLGLFTAASCQGDGEGEAWLNFENGFDLTEFLAAAVPYDDNENTEDDDEEADEGALYSLWDRVTHCDHEGDNPGAWEYLTHVHPDDEGDFHLIVTAYFPRQDIAELTANLNGQVAELTRRSMEAPHPLRPRFL